MRRFLFRYLDILQKFAFRAVARQLHDVDGRDSGQIHVSRPGTPSGVGLYQLVLRERFG